MAHFGQILLTDDNTPGIRVLTTRAAIMIAAHLLDFMTTVRSLLTSTVAKVKYDLLVLNSIRLLATIAKRPSQKHLFENDSSLANITEIFSGTSSLEVTISETWENLQVTLNMRNQSFTLNEMLHVIC